MNGLRIEAPPPDRASPVIVEVPHAGLAVPDAVREQVRSPLGGRMRDADIWVDQLWAGAPAAGAHLLVADVSRHVVDLNRAEDDLDPRVFRAVDASAQRRAGRGAIWAAGTDGRRILTRALTRDDVAQRLERYHRAYHRALRELIDHARDRFGFAIVLAAHSMPSRGRNVRGGPILTRADAVPGTLGRTSAATGFIDIVDRALRSGGLSVAHDDPYRGGFTTKHYGRPKEGVHVVQIELSRSLYCDERTQRPHDGLDRLRPILDSIVSGLATAEL